MKKNKILILVIVLLAAGLILETGYLIGSKRQEMMPRLSMGGSLRPPTNPAKVYRWSPNPVAMEREQEGLLANVDQVQRTNPAVEMAKIQEGIRQMSAGASAMGQMIADNFNSRYTDNTLSRSAEFFVPNIDIRDIKDAYEINADLPGMKKEEISIELEGRYLTISGATEEHVRNEGSSQQESNYEAHYGHFSRTITLPDDAKTSGITSEYKNGVLSIKIPKIESVKQVKPSPVKVLVQ